MDELLAKTLDPTSGDPIIHDVWSPILTEAAFREMPALQFLPVVPNTQGNPYRFNRRVAMPVAYPEGSSASPQTVGNNSTYEEVAVELKVIRAYGAYDRFVGATVRQLDLAKQEVLGAARSVAEQLCGQIFWGDTVANPYTFNGFDAAADINVIDWGSNEATCALLDQMLDASMQPGTSSARRIFFASNQVISRISQDFASTYHAQLPMGEYTYPYTKGSIRLVEWRGVPIVPVSFTRPMAQAGTLTLTGDNTGGSLPGATYYVAVAPVTRYGEQLAVTGDVQVPESEGNTGSITITLPAPFSHPNVNSAYGEALYWKIYVGTSADDMPLVAVVNALQYNASGTPTNYVDEYVYTGECSARRGAVGTAPAGSEDQPLLGDLSTGVLDECVFLICADAGRGCEVPCTGFPEDTTIGYYDLLALTQLGPIRDSRDFLVKTYATLAVRWGATHVIARRVRARTA